MFIDHVVTISGHLNDVVSYLGNSVKGRSLLPLSDFRPEIFKEYKTKKNT